MDRCTGKRVFVGLSGGVDSAVTAALLKRAGAKVTGVFIKGWYPPGLPCTWASDRRDAMRVAAKLQIPFRTLDASAAYKKSVIDYLIEEYRNGRTPNPDIMCNRDVKFGAFYEYLLKEGADALATGHYARTHLDAAGKPHLFRGKDAAKDQSYFLWAVAQDALAKTLFPLGEFHKEDVRERARSYGLPVAAKKDSQGICFLGPVSMDDFLRAEFGEAVGKALDTQGKEIGKHDGALLYTLGERIALTDAPGGPWYVVRKDIKKNEVVVAHEREAVSSKGIALSSVNWLTHLTPGEQVTAQYRYHGPLVAGTLDTSSTTFLPDDVLPEPLASGQSLVVYRGEECLGGGIIS